jgi:hypothetical protein
VVVACSHNDLLNDAPNVCCQTLMRGLITLASQGRKKTGRKVSDNTNDRQGESGECSETTSAWFHNSSERF